MGEHAILSASNSHRWLNCTPSAILEQNFNNENSTFAAEGTAAHALAEHKLRRLCKIPTKRPVSEYDSQELDYFTDIYVTYACELIADAHARSPDPIILIEQKLDFSHYVPEGFGTGDLIIVADDVLDVVDLKYGRGIEVSAEWNPQMMLYALGALALFDSLYDIQKVRMTICQPRLDSISSFELMVDELLLWAEKELKPKAELAIKGAGEYVPGEHCRFCRARHRCRARADANLEIAKYDFKRPPLLTDDEICEVLAKAENISSWVGDVWAYALEQAVNQGKKWPGYKLVEGRSNRKYTDEAKVAEILTGSGYTESQLYTKNLIGITAMEKLLGKKKFADLLSDLIEKPQGKPALVAEADKRPEIKVINTALADFN